METKEDYEYKMFTRNFFDIGSKVQLLSGRPLMTIEKLHNLTGVNQAESIWHAGNKVERLTADLSALTLLQ